MIQITEEIKARLIELGNTPEDIERLRNEYGFDFKRENGKISLKNIDKSQLADYFISKYRIYTIFDILHYFEDGLYKALSDDDFDRIVINEVYNSTINSRKELKRYIKAQAKQKTPSHERYILFNNGIYDLKEKKLLPISSDLVFCNRIPHNYIENAKEQPIFDEFVASVVNYDEDCAKLLKQIIGYTFYRKNPLQVFYFLYGNGGNGKSTLLKFIAYIVGKENTCYLTITDLEDEFNLPQLKGKLLNIGDDVEDSYIDNVGILKKIVSGETFTAGAKYKDKEQLHFDGKTLFSGNVIPRAKDKTGGLKRRMNILPLLNNFNGSARDINILDKLCTKEVAEYCIYECISELIEVLENKAFIKPKIVDEANFNYTIANNHVLEFIEEYAKEITAKEAGVVYKIYYKNFCEDIGAKPLGRYAFYEAMRNVGYKKIQDDSLTGRPYMFIKEAKDVVK